MALGSILAEETAREVAKEVAVEASKEVVKTAENIEEFGIIDKALEAKETVIDKFNAENRSSQISFGSLANGAFKFDENYLKWKDGVDVGEVNRKWIDELANEISAIFGAGNITVDEKCFYKHHRFNNASMLSGVGKLSYDPKYLVTNGNAYGEDKILGTLAHEVGHRAVYKIGLEEQLSDYEHEACADYIAGLTSRLCKLNPQHMMSWFNVQPPFAIGEHPGRSVRINSFLRGYYRIDRGDEATILKTFEDFSPYDFQGVYKDEDLLRDILYEDVINPLRNGEIKKV